MANWSQSQFLQSLGWATLNSFWQMALLWCLYLAILSVFKVSSVRKYQLAVGSILAGFLWFVVTFLYYFNSKSVSGLGFFERAVSESNGLLNMILIAASTAYLSLLLFPSYRLLRNWQFVQRIKKHGLHKADLNYRLFVQKISAQIGIGKKVLVYVSDLVTSPVTVGYLKPIVLLPVAALSNLSIQQVEAILLHELSHIRRYDYLVNLMISVISTILYFNPFVKHFIGSIEEERENCCDQLVLQYGYDRIGYASALLTLEKFSAARHALALGAAGKKNYLVSRIEKIVGMEQKKRFKRSQFAGLLAALFCIVVFNSVLIIKDKEQNNQFYSSIEMANPFSLFEETGNTDGNYLHPSNRKAEAGTWMASTRQEQKTVPVEVDKAVPEQPVYQPGNMFIQVAANDIELSLNKEQKEKVRTTVDVTKKLLVDLQWKEVETVIADVLTDNEKIDAKKEFIGELNKSVDWNNVEQNIKAQYEHIDWQKVDNKMKNALVGLQLDSLQKTYKVVLSELNKLTVDVKENHEVTICPLPDQSIEQIQKAREELSSRVNSIKALRSTKKVVRL